MIKSAVLLFTALGITGTTLISMVNPTLAAWANVIWIASNLGLMTHNILIRERAQAFMFGVYLIFAMVGAWRWAAL